MATLDTSTSAQGTLTGSPTTDTIYTAGAGVLEESVTVVFINYACSTVTLDLFSGGTADQNRLVGQPVSLLSKEMLVLECTLAPNEDIRALGGAATSIAYTRKARIIS